jgi:hypothetical protein
LADAVRSRFGQDSVFFDTSDIDFGQEWPAALRAALDSSSVVLAVIGPEWILARDEYGRRRIDDPRDWVRNEIQFAIEAQKRLVPLLVRHARVPPPDALPTEIARLSERQAFGIRGEAWRHDVNAVLDELNAYIAPAVGVSAPSKATDASGPNVTADDFRALALGFDSAAVSTRDATVAPIKEMAASLSLDEVLALTRSRKPAERVGAAIALGVHIRASAQARDDLRVRSALGELLTDPSSSRIRYRAAEVVRSSPALIATYRDDLEHLAETDTNRYVRNMAANALRRQRG